MQVTTERHRATEVIRYENPPKSFLTLAGCDDLLAAFRAAEADDEVRVIVFTGAGPGAFIRHVDVELIIGVGELLSAGKVGPEILDSGGGGFAGLLLGVSSCPKPVIAAITGTCMGGGLELSLACDLRVIGTYVDEIGMPEVKVGICGGTQRLPLIVGMAKALDLILTGRLLDAQQAVDIGLVNEAADDPVSRALELGAHLETMAPEVIRAIKSSVRRASEAALEPGYDYEREQFAELLTSGPTLNLLKRYRDVDTDLDRL